MLHIAMGKVLVLASLLLAASPGFAFQQAIQQTLPETPVAPPAITPPKSRPLPDIPTLMHLVETHQRADEALLKDYIYRSSTTFQKVDKAGSVKQTESTESDIFWIRGVQVRRITARNGKPLTPDEAKKESDRIDKMVGKSADRREKADAQGKETDSHGNEEITVSRLLELGSFTNPRRIQVNGRDTIVVDFTGDPKAKTHNPGESAIHDMIGTVAVDEADGEVQHLDGSFVRDFKVGGGLLVSVSKGTSFALTTTRINNEVWLPASFEAHGHVRYLLFFTLEGNVASHQSDYRKFKATSTISPVITTVEETPDPTPAPTPPKP